MTTHELSAEVLAKDVPYRLPFIEGGKARIAGVNFKKNPFDDWLWCESWEAGYRTMSTAMRYLKRQGWEAYGRGTLSTDCPYNTDQWQRGFWIAGFDAHLAHVTNPDKKGGDDQKGLTEKDRGRYFFFRKVDLAKVPVESKLSISWIVTAKESSWKILAYRTQAGMWNLYRVYSGMYILSAKPTMFFMASTYAAAMERLEKEAMAGCTKESYWHLPHEHDADLDVVGWDGDGGVEDRKWEGGE